MILGEFCAADSKPCLEPAAVGCANWKRSAEARSQRAHGKVSGWE